MYCKKKICVDCLQVFYMYFQFCSAFANVRKINEFLAENYQFIVLFLLYGFEM